MKRILEVLCLLAVSICAKADSEPCERLSELVGEAMGLIRHDYYINKITEGGASRELDFVKEEILSMIGVDFSDPRKRQEFICRAFDVKKLSEVYDFITNETPAARYNFTYNDVCMDYQRFLRHREKGYMVELSAEFVDLAYTATKDLVTWMDSSGFPDRFPIRGRHVDNVNALKEIEILFGEEINTPRFYMLRELLTQLIPIWPLPKWEKEQGRNQTTAEDVVTWMEESKSIFVYAEKIRDNSISWFNLGRAQSSYDLLEFEKIHYDKILWYKEALGYVLDTNLLHLDVSDCPPIQQ